MAENEAEESKTAVAATDFSQGGDQWPPRTQTMVVVNGGNLGARSLLDGSDELAKSEQEDKIAKARQTVNVYDLSRGSLARLGMDPAEIRLARERAHEIKFALKYDRRRSDSAFSKRNTFFRHMSQVDRCARTESVIAAAQEAEHDVW